MADLIPQDIEDRLLACLSELKIDPLTQQMIMGTIDAEIMKLGHIRQMRPEDWPIPPGTEMTEALVEKSEDEDAEGPDYCEHGEWPEQCKICSSHEVEPLTEGPARIGNDGRGDEWLEGLKARNPKFFGK